MSEVQPEWVKVAAEAIHDQRRRSGQRGAPGVNELEAAWALLALAAAAPLIRQDERRATAGEIAAALTAEAERAGGPIFTRAMEYAVEIVDRVAGVGGGGQ